MSYAYYEKTKSGKMPNEKAWNELSKLEVFSDKSNPEYQNCVKWLEAIKEAGSRFREIELIRLGGLIETVYKAGIRKK